MGKLPRARDARVYKHQWPPSVRARTRRNLVLAGLACWLAFALASAAHHVLVDKPNAQACDADGAVCEHACVRGKYGRTCKWVPVGGEANPAGEPRRAPAWLAWTQGVSLLGGVAFAAWVGWHARRGRARRWG